jgi:uncharacterized protein (TIGR02246 family)
MSRLATAVAVTFLLAVISCAHHPNPSALGSEPLEERERAFLAALSARDLEQVAAHFSQDAVVHVAGFAPLRGRSAIRQFYANVFRSLSESEATPESTRVSQSGDMAWGLGRVTNVFEGPDGRSEFAGKYLLVWEHRDGEWSIAAYSVSSNQPDPGR